MGGATTRWGCLLCLSVWALPGDASRYTSHDAWAMIPGAVPAHGQLLAHQGATTQRALQQNPRPLAGKSGSVIAWGDLRRIGPTPPEVQTGHVIKIAAGQYLGLALLDSHDVVMWSPYTLPSYTVPERIQGEVVDIAAGSYHAVVLLKNGSLVAWGANDHGQCDIPSMMRPESATVRVIQIATTNWHNLALLSNGSVVAWGWGFAGQTDVPQAAKANVTYIAVSERTSWAVLSSGAMVEWGRKTDITLHRDILPISIGGGIDHVIMASRNGSVTAWNYTDSSPPSFYYPDVLPLVEAVPHAASSHVIAVGAADNVSMALLDTGEVVAWGKLPSGFQPISPVPEMARSNVIAMSVAKGYGMALVEGVLTAPAPPPPPPPHPMYPPAPPPPLVTSQGESGSVVVWGNISHLGPLPDNVTTGVVAIAGGCGYAMALLDNNQVVVWGHDSARSLKNVPQGIQGHIADIAAGCTQALALLSNGSVVGWGDSHDSGAVIPPDLGPGNSAQVLSIAAGYFHSLALLANGSVVAWGDNRWGQTDVPSAARENVTAVYAGRITSLAVLSDGTLVQWGASNPNADVDQIGVVSAAVGTDQLVALLRDGTVACWTYDTEPPEWISFSDILPDVTRVPADAQSHVVAVAAHENISVALLDTGIAVLWGASLPPVPLVDRANMVAVAAGAGFAMAIKSSGQHNLPIASNNSPGSNSASGGSIDSPSTQKVALIVGVVVGVAAAAALLAVTIIYLVKKRTLPTQQSWALSTPKDSNQRGCHMDLPGVPHGHFTRMVAYEFQWADYKAIPGKTVSVEAGITDVILDQALRRDGEGKGKGCPVVQLSKEEVKDQLVLLRDGILGKGATAMVFQCLWPSRFGPDALLAAKVLREGSDADTDSLQSFAHEAAVLSTLLHPNVVRLYGYCIEPPTVVLILELLPTSLRSLLYEPAPSAGHNSPSASNGVLQNKAGLQTVAGSIHPAEDTLHQDARGDTASPLHSVPQQQSEVVLTTPTPTSTGDAVSQNQASSQPGAGASPHGASAMPPQEADVAILVQQEEAAVRQLTVREVLTISADIAAGLAYMHDRAGAGVELASPFEERSIEATDAARVVHRDLKPANILINSKGHAKISDFGLARQHHQTTIRTAHLAAGTLPYMAPELLAHAAGGYSHVSATNRVDIYSLAMIIWEQLAGQPPWKDVADTALVVAVAQGIRPPLPEPPTEEPQLHPDLLDQPASLEVLPQLNAVVRACWRQRELKRPTATAVLHELNTLLLKLGTSPTELPTNPDAVAISIIPEPGALATQE